MHGVRYFGFFNGKGQKIFIEIIIKERKTNNTKSQGDDCSSSNEIWDLQSKEAQSKTF